MAKDNAVERPSEALLRQGKTGDEGIVRLPSGATYFSAKAIARLFRCSVMSVSRWRRKGKLQGRRIGHSYYFSE